MKRVTRTRIKSRDPIDAAEQQILEQSKRIEFYLTEYSVELLAHKMENGDFQVPSYQREFTWEPERKSRFIESVIIGLPIPFLFFWEMPDGKLEIVDGSQRLRTLAEFLSGDLKLSELEGLSLISGTTFNDLLPSRQRKIRNRSIRGIVLNEHADEQARFDLFERINTGSKIANTAEVRRGALAGPFMDLVIELAKDDLFCALAPVSNKDMMEREREELVSRFFAYSDGLEGYRDRPADFVFAYTKEMNTCLEDNPDLIKPLVQKFHDTIDFIGRNFPNGFRKTPKGRATPRARYEAIAVGSALALMESPRLSRRTLDTSKWLESNEFKKIISSDGANVKSKLRERIDFVKRSLLEN